MRCLVLRHAPAEPRTGIGATDGSPDEARALTRKGMRRARRAGRVLAKLVPDLGWVAASPLRRAQQTAAPLAAALGQRVVTLEALAPGAWPALWPWLAEARDAVCLVGHAPDLDAFVCAALTGKPEPTFVALRKGGAALLEFTGEPRAGHAELRWLLTPRLLRKPRAR